MQENVDEVAVNDMLPLISVIIPTRNRAELLRRAIESVLAQTWKGDLEIIVISDGSTDHTDEVVASFDDPRIRFLKHETARGASAARNTGIRASSGKYLAFLDDDDEWVPRKLEIQVQLIESAGSEVGLVYAWMEYVRDGKVVDSRKPTLRGNIFREMLDKQAITNSSTLLVRREVLDVVQGFDENLPRGNDGDFIRRISKYYHVDYIPKVLARVHVGHADRISVNSRENLLAGVQAQKKRLLVFAEDFRKHPTPKSNVLLRIAVLHAMAGDWMHAFLHYAKSFATCPLNPRIYSTMPKILTGLIKSRAFYSAKGE